MPQLIIILIWMAGDKLMLLEIYNIKVKQEDGISFILVIVKFKDKLMSLLDLDKEQEIKFLKISIIMFLKDYISL